MPQLHILKITEIFSSIQGEGLRQGEASIFIRLSGCNLKCAFCDTKYAWEGGKEMLTTHVVEKAKKLRKQLPTKWVCLTGGEPLLQDVKALVKTLKEENFKVQVETNATIYRSLSVDWYTVSPKPENYFYQPVYRKRAKEVKVVVTKGLEFGVVQTLRQEFPDKIPILLQPQSNMKWSMNLGIKLLRQALQADLKNIRLSIQLHKIYGLR
ncbi:MAG: 7-carboxy-7-deazaguanine synthase QueE [Candidatus Aminicenantes bacterium]|nr:MAG: 7-carboxy-7-deazaguanine synthase QueE [Candidatus Aminicenantes bacterium]